MSLTIEANEYKYEIEQRKERREVLILNSVEFDGRILKY